MGSLGSFALGFLTFMLTMPVSVEFSEYGCVQGTECPPPFTTCYTVLGWENVLGPLGCSGWAAAGVGLLVGLLARAVGTYRVKATYPSQ